MTVNAKLSNAVLAVCPIHGVSMGDRFDKSTWRIDFRPEATQAQRAQAQAVVASFVVPVTQAQKDRFNEDNVHETWVGAAAQRVHAALIADPDAAQLTKAEWMDLLVVSGIITYTREPDGSMSFKPGPAVQVRAREI